MIEFDSELLALNKLLIRREDSADPLTQDILILANTHFMSGILMEKLWSRLDIQAQHEIQAQLRPIAVLQLRQENTQRHIQGLMDAAQIPLLWIKGAALAYTLYSQPYHRPMGDVDCLVHLADYEQASDVLLHAGYQEIHALGHSFGGDQELTTHHRQFVHPDRHVMVELHYRFGTTLLQVEEMEWFWQNPLEFHIQGTTMRTLRPEAHFIYLCTHLFMQHDPAEISLLRLWDLYLLAQYESMDWELLKTKTMEYGWETAVTYGLQALIDIFDVPLPDTTSEWVHNLNSLSLSREPIDRFRQAIKKLSWPQRVQLLRSIVFPSRTYMEKIYPNRGRSTPIPWRYLRRWQSLIIQTVRYGWHKLRENLHI